MEKNEFIVAAEWVRDGAVAGPAFAGEEEESLVPKQKRRVVADASYEETGVSSHLQVSRVIPRFCAPSRRTTTTQACMLQTSPHYVVKVEGSS